jgi:hypothetical protein
MSNKYVWECECGVGMYESDLKKGHGETCCKDCGAPRPQNKTYIDLRNALESHNLTEAQKTKLVKGWAKSDIAIYGKQRWFRYNGQLEAAQKAIKDGGKE